MGGPFGTGEYFFDALEQRIDNVLVTDGSVARGTCHVRSRKPLQETSCQECRPNQCTSTTETSWANGHHRWAGAIVLTGDERHKQHVPEGENCLNIGSSEFVNV